jgi:cysteinyl-tRNA synthetase
MSRVYNSLSKQVEAFRPLAPGKVSMYVCGPTVYGLLHIGNGRTFMFWDVARRWFEYQGHEVTYVQNFTDIDDKIINRAAEEGVSAAEVAEKYTRAYFEDMDAFGVRRATHYPKATEAVGEMIAHIQGLVDKGLAYAVDGDVYFRVRAFPGYGKLSGRTTDDNEAGARVDVDARKEDAADFAMWKAAKPGEPAWDSPWGPGRPGWHIECSAMVRAILGDTIDVHAGGKDLKFPHHENEIAQSEGLTGHPFVRYWMHTGFLNMESEKMSKSLGNIRTTRDVVAAYGAQAVRYFMLQTKYRSDLDFSDDAVRAAEKGLMGLRELLARLDADAAGKADGGAFAARVREGFVQAMENDLGTPDALAHFNVVADELRRKREEVDPRPAIAEMRAIADRVFGLDLSAPKVDVAPVDEALKAFVEQAIAERRDAKAQKNWTRADEIRKALAEKDVVLVDQKDGTTTWQLAPKSVV